MLIGVMGAMGEEVEWMVRHLKKTGEREMGRRIYHQGNLGGADVVLAYSRVGKVSSASTATTLIDVFGVDLILFTGLAGGVRNDLEVGDVVIASELVQYDMDGSALPMFKKFEIPLLGIQRFPVRPEDVALALRHSQNYLDVCLWKDVDAALLQEFHLTKPKAVSGLIGSGDQFIASSEKVAELTRELPGLTCLEMEGAAVAQVCYEHGIPVIVMRVISDKADHSAHIDFTKFLEKIASPLSGGIAITLLESLAGSKRPTS